MQINRARIALPFAFVTLLLVAWTRTSAQGVKITAQKVAGSVHMVTGRGGNLGVSVGPDGVLLIDDQFANLAPQIQAALDSIAEGAGLASGTPRFLINTHHHADHTGGNVAFGESATILAHENVRTRLLTSGRGGPMAAQGLPMVTYEQGLSIHFNGEQVRLLHLPGGHTDGDTVVFFTESNVVHMGDLFFNGRFPYVDLDSGGSVSGYLENIALVLEATDSRTRFLPGHGELSGRSELEEFHEVLSDVVGIVGAALEEGMTGTEIKEADLLSEYAQWGKGGISTERMIDTVVRELGQ